MWYQSFSCIHHSISVATLCFISSRFDGKRDAYSIFLCGYFSATQVFVMMVIPAPASQEIQQKPAFISGFVIQIAGFAVILIMAFASSTHARLQYTLPAGYFLIARAMVCSMLSLTIFLSDSVDYGEVMNGTRGVGHFLNANIYSSSLRWRYFLQAGLVVDWIHLDTAVRNLNTGYT